MHGYLLPVDAARLAFVIGIVVSLVLYERRHLSTGSVVVPGYIGAFMLSPLILVVTLVNAVAVHLLVGRVAARWAGLHGRNKFTALALCSVSLQLISLQLMPHVSASLYGIGFMIPGLIAHDMARQGVRRTAVAILGTGIAVGSFALAVVSVLPFVAGGRPVTGQPAPLVLDSTWVPFAALFAVIAASALFSNYGLRSGGFIGGMYLGLLATDLAAVALLVIVALVTWIVVTRLFQANLVLFGRRKFAAMLLVSSSLSWFVVTLFEQGVGGDHWSSSPLSTMVLVPLFVPGLLANDVERAGLWRTALGTALAIAFVFSWSRLAAGSVTRGSFPVLIAVAVISTAIAFGPQIAWMARSLRASWPRRYGIGDPARSGARDKAGLASVVRMDGERRAGVSA